MELTTRNINPTDLGWLEPLYKNLMSPYYEVLGIPWINENFYKGIDYRISRVVMLDGVAIGYVKVELRTDCLYLGDIVLKPEFQGRGFGTQLMMEQIARSSSEGLPIKLRVLKGNRANEFYQRLGFEVIEELDVALMMQREVERVMEIGLIGGVEKRDIVICEYDQNWPSKFEQHKARVNKALGDSVLSIEHVGSTSVPGLAAKAIIDIDLVVADSSDENSYLPQLTQAGYQLRVREPDWQEHRMFRTPEIDVHIHVFSPGASELSRHLVFRNWLRENEDDRCAYESTKRELSSRSWDDMNAYADAKTEIVESILAKASEAGE